MELLYEHPVWTTVWLIIIFGCLSEIKIGGRKND